MLSCNQYDYIEIACMHKLPVNVLLANNVQVIGTAVTTTIIHDGENKKQECMLIETLNQDQTLVELAQIVELSITQSNPYFISINFRNGNLTK